MPSEQVRVIQNPEIEARMRKSLTIKDAVLIQVDGCGKLSTRSRKAGGRYREGRSLRQLCFEGTPLVQINAPDCPTCHALLATGYGIGEPEKELTEAIEEALNAPFVSIEKSIEDLTPLLALLKSGSYIVADALCFPTDGDGRFFWNVPNRPTANPATATIFLEEEDFVIGQPVYLFPTQDTDCYRAERVQHYVKRMEEGEPVARAIAYGITECINLLLDGHHRACAAALLGRPLECLLIIPHEINSGEKNSPKFKVEAGSINHRDWEKEYLRSAGAYPAVEEFVQMIGKSLDPAEKGFCEKVTLCLEDLTLENEMTLRAALLALRFSDPGAARELAESCAKTASQGRLKEEAFCILSAYKNDPAVEQIFVEYIVANSDAHDPMLAIANAYVE